MGGQNRRGLNAVRHLDGRQIIGQRDHCLLYTSNLHALLSEVNNRINLVNLKEKLQDSEDMSEILNIALDQIEFTFRKVSESEMVIADQYQDTLEKTRRELERSLDPKDPEYITLLEELKRIFKKKNIEELTADEMQQQIQDLERIRKTAAQQNLRDQMLCAKYGGDAKYMRTHKRIKASPPPIGSDPVIFDILMGCLLYTSLPHGKDFSLCFAAQFLIRLPPHGHAAHVLPGSFLMVIWLVTHGDLLFLDFPPQLSVHLLSHRLSLIHISSLMKPANNCK